MDDFCHKAILQFSIKPYEVWDKFTKDATNHEDTIILSDQFDQ